MKISKVFLFKKTTINQSYEAALGLCLSLKIHTFNWSYEVNLHTAQKGQLPSIKICQVFASTDLNEN